MRHRWELFLENNKPFIVEKYIEVLMPKLSGLLLYHFYHSDSYEEATEFDEEKARCQDNFRSVNTFYHNEPVTFYYKKTSPASDSTLDYWLGLYQFTEHNGIGNWNLPNTWENALEEWICELRDFHALGAILESRIDPAIKDFFQQECRRYERASYESTCDNIWREVYMSELDDGMLCIS